MALPLGRMTLQTKRPEPHHRRRQWKHHSHRTQATAWPCTSIAPTASRALSRGTEKVAANTCVIGGVPPKRRGRRSSMRLWQRAATAVYRAVLPINRLSQDLGQRGVHLLLRPGSRLIQVPKAPSCSGMGYPMRLPMHRCSARTRAISTMTFSSPLNCQPRRLVTFRTCCRAPQKGSSSRSDFARSLENPDHPAVGQLGDVGK